jgi:hypothetical protein
MPQYFFHIEDGTSAVDPDGFELKDLAEAKCEAVIMAGRMICDASKEFWDRAEWQMTVTDDTGLTLFMLDIIGTEAPASVARVHSAAA